MPSEELPTRPGSPGGPVGRRPIVSQNIRRRRQPIRDDLTGLEGLQRSSGVGFGRPLAAAVQALGPGYRLDARHRDRGPRNSPTVSATPASCRTLARRRAEPHANATDWHVSPSLGATDFDRANARCGLGMLRFGANWQSPPALLRA